MFKYVDFYVDSLCSVPTLAEIPGQTSLTDEQGAVIFNQITFSTPGKFYYQASSLGAFSTCSSEYLKFLGQSDDSFPKKSILTDFENHCPSKKIF